MDFERILKKALFSILSLNYWKQYKQKFNILFNKKFKNWFHFLPAFHPDYVAHCIIKEFLKNSNFEKMTAGFLLRCQNLLRWDTPEMMHLLTDTISYEITEIFWNKNLFKKLWLLILFWNIDLFEIQLTHKWLFYDHF